MQNNILKSYKNNNIIVIFSIITLLFFSLGFILAKNKEKECQKFLDNKITSNQYVYIEITKPPIPFKVTLNGSSSQNFYILSNSKHYYIAKMSLHTYTKLMTNYKKNKEDFSFKFEGTTKNIYETLKKTSIKVLNETNQEELLTNSNYDNYIGEFYIDGFQNPSFDIKLIFYLLGTFFFVLTIILLIEYFNASRNLKKILQKYSREELEKELGDKSTISYRESGTYFTRKYLISNVSGFKVIPYQDICWTYILKSKTKGVTIGKQVMIRTKDNKIYSIAFSQNEKLLREIIKKIYEKNNNILIDFTNDNLEKYKEMIKIK